MIGTQTYCKCTGFACGFGFVGCGFDLQHLLRFAFILINHLSSKRNMSDIIFGCHEWTNFTFIKLVYTSFLNQINSRELKGNVQTPGHIGPVKTKEATQHKNEGIKIIFFDFFHRLFLVYNFYPEPPDISRQFYLELPDYYMQKHSFIT